MKSLILILVLSLSCAQAFSQEKSTTVANAETLSLKESSFDFGKIVQGKPVTHDFVVTNTGSEPLQIENVLTSCGCTTPEWNREPIAPGASSSIRVGYNAAAEGPFSKSVSIVYNNNRQAAIIISGTVFKAPATAAPLNASISLLKQTNQ